MGAGSGFAGFGAGFAKGLAGQLHENQLQKREDERRAQEKRDQTNLAMFPHIFEASGGDLNAMEPWLQTAFPDTFGAPGKKTKAPKAGESSPLDMVGRVFNHFRTRLPGQSSTGPDSTDPSGVTNPTALMDTGVGRTLPSGPVSDSLSPILAAAPAAAGGQSNMLPAPLANDVIPGTGIPTTVQPRDGDAATVGTGGRKTFMGVPLLTPEEKADRAALGDTAKIQAKVRAAQKYAGTLLANGQASTPAEAFRLSADLFGLYSTQSANGAPNQSVPGTIDGKSAFGVFNKLDGKYHDPVSGDVLTNFKPAIGGGARNPMGTIGTQAAVKLGFDSVQAAIEAGKHKELTATIEELIQEQSKKRALGTGLGNFEAPMTAAQAQATGGVVGSSSADMAGQTVQSLAQRDRVNGITSLKAGIQHILDAGLLNILPTDKGLAGQVPGAAIAIKRRNNMASGIIDPETKKPLTNREAMAKLDAVVDSMLATLSRVAQGERGATTEPDVQRAYSSLVNLKGKLTDPLSGDTQESAQIRIREALSSLDRVLATLGNAPRPGAGAGAPKAGAKVGPDPANPKAPYQDEKGNWILP